MNRITVTTSLELITRAKGLLSRLQFAEAEECYQKAIALDSRSTAALVGLGRLALLNQRADDALPLLDWALLLQPDCAEALAVKGICWMQQKEFDRAIEVLEQAKVLDPNLRMVYFNLGRSYCELGQFPDAEENLLKAIEMNPEHFEAYSRLGYAQIRSGRLKDGIHSMLKATRINPRYITGYLVLGELYERAGKRDLGIRLYHSGIQRNPRAFPLRERLCSLYALNRDFPSAFQEALEIVNCRDFYTDYLRLGSYAAALHQFETAERAFETSIQLNPTSWEGHYNLAELYMSAQLMDQAREQYQTALDKNRGGYEPFNGMGLFVLMVDHDCDRAIGLFKQAIEHAPSRPEPQLNLALAYAKKRDFPAAQRFASSVLLLTEPGDPFYDQAERLQGSIRIESHTFQVLR
jgi:tetratricopeptide (TPR) repeat protein